MVPYVLLLDPDTVAVGTRSFTAALLLTAALVGSDLQQQTAKSPETLLSSADQQPLGLGECSLALAVLQQQLVM